MTLFNNSLLLILVLLFTSRILNFNRSSQFSHKFRSKTFSLQFFLNLFFVQQLYAERSNRNHDQKRWKTNIHLSSCQSTEHYWYQRSCDFFSKSCFFFVESLFFLSTHLLTSKKLISFEALTATIKSNIESSINSSKFWKCWFFWKSNVMKQ